MQRRGSRSITEERCRESKLKNASTKPFRMVEPLHELFKNWNATSGGIFRAGSGISPQFFFTHGRQAAECCLNMLAETSEENQHIPISFRVVE